MYKKIHNYISPKLRTSVFASMVFMFVFLMMSFDSLGQISYSQSFNSCDATSCNGWSISEGYLPSITSTSGNGYSPCNTASAKANIYGSATTTTLVTTSSLGTSSGQPATLTMSAKAINWSTGAATAAAACTWTASWGTSESGPWNTISSVNNISSTSCNTYTFSSFTPTAGQPIFIRIVAVWNNGDFWAVMDDITLTQAADPCAAAINIPSVPVTNQSLVCTGAATPGNLNATNVPTACGDASNSYKGGQEALYTFTPSVSGDYRISIDGQTWTSIFVYSGSCPASGGTCVGSIGSSTTTKELIVSLTAGTLYYIWFDTYPAPDSPCPGTFSLSAFSCETPGTPTSPIAAETNHTTASLSWSASSTVGSPTVTYYWSVGTSPSHTYSSGYVTRGTTSSTSTSATGLSCGTNYYLRVYAETNCDNTSSGIATSSPFSLECLPSCDYNVPFTGSESISTASGSICDHAGWGIDYSDHANGFTVINPAVSGQMVRLTFTHFETESGYDFVNIFDGVGIGGTLLWSGSGTSMPPIITSSTGSLTIQFTSDHSQVRKGFRALISNVLISTCSGVYVCGSTGQDVNAGTSESPVRTLTRAIEIASANTSRNHIRMTAGTYTESSILNLQNDLIIEGRYINTAGVWSKSSNTSSSTTITCSGSETVSGVCHRMGFKSDSKSGWKLIDLNITTTAASGTDASSRGCSNYAVWISNSSNYEISRCNITSGNASGGANGSGTAANGGAGSTSTPSGGAGKSGNNTTSNAGSLAPDNASGNGSAGTGGPSYGTGGAAGGRGATSGTCSAGSGCGTAGCNGPAGKNGGNGESGKSWNVGDRPTAATISSLYFTPNGQAESGGGGGGGGSGSGGSGNVGGRYACIDCAGHDGGAGGRGGSGGGGGLGGFGGGGSFAIWRINSNTGATLLNNNLSTGNVGSGGTGANGQTAPNTGRTNGGGSSCNDCWAGSRCSGVGGNGGYGGNGGRGRDGANGISSQMVVNGTTSSPSATIPNGTIVTLSNLPNRICANSTLQIKTSAASWSLPSGWEFTKYNNTAASSQYNNSSTDAEITTTNSSGTYNLTANSVVFNSYLNVASERTLPVISLSASSVCLGGTVDLSASSWGVESDFIWEVFSGTNADNKGTSTNRIFNATTQTSSVTLNTAGTYTVRYQVKETCCGWSKPVFATIIVYPSFNSGEISSTGQTICYGGTPSVIGSNTAASGGDGTITYSWRSSADGYSAAISGATSATYTPPSGLTTSTSYRRYAKDNTCYTTPEVSSGTWTVTVRDNFTTGTISSSGQTICYGGTPSSIGSNTAASGGDETITYSWRSSADGYSAAISGATSATYTPPSGLTATTSYQRYAKDNTCNTTPTVSSGTWTVTVRPNFTAGAINTTGETICYNGNPALIGSSTAASGGDESITYEWRANETPIASTNSATYDPPAGLTTTTTYTRWAKDNTCNTDWSQSSGSWLVTVQTPPTSPTSITGTLSLCEGATTTLSASGGSNGDGAVYQWGTGSVIGTSIISGANSVNYTTSSLSTSQTYWVRRIGNTACTNTTDGVTTTVNVYPQPQVEIVNDEQLACKGAELIYEASGSNGTGTAAYQWQKKAGAVWNDIMSNGTSNTYLVNTNTIGVFDYRVKYSTNGIGCNEVYSDPIILKVKRFPYHESLQDGDYVWVGKNDQKWDDIDNWRIFRNENQYDDAVSLPSVSNNVFIIDNTSCVYNPDVVAEENLIIRTNNFILDNDFSFKLQSNITLQISGDVVLNGEGLFQNNSKVEFVGLSQQTVLSNESSLNNVEFKNTSNLPEAIVLADNMIIKNNAIFTSGIVSTGNYVLHFESGATSNAGNSNSFVDGKVQRNGTGEFTMPIGHVNQRDLGQGAGMTQYKIWAPLSFTPQSEAIVSVRYKFSNENLPTWWHHDWTHQAPLQHTSGQEYWLVESNVNLTDVRLHWANNDPCYIHGMCEHGTTNFHSEHLTVAYWDGIWKDAGGELEPSSSYTQGSILSSVPFIPFGSKTQRFVTFGSKDSELPLPIELAAFVANCSNHTKLLRWTTLSEINNDYFLLEKSLNGLDFEIIAQIQGQGNSNQTINYSYHDDVKHQGTVYYRLIQTDFDGSKQIFPMISVDCSQEPDIKIMPNPFKSVVYVCGLPTDCLVEIFGAKGERLQSFNNNDANMLEMNLEHLSSGIYFVKIIQNNGQHKAIKLVKN